jgi:hypothetical protein
LFLNRIEHTSYAAEAKARAEDHGAALDICHGLVRIAIYLGI